MYDLAAIESINAEQLATATDRLLLRGRVSKRRPSSASFARIEPPTPARVPSTVGQARINTFVVMVSMFTMAMLVTTLF